MVVIFPEQAKAPVELVIVQPVEAEPPPIKMSPEELLFKFNTPLVPASMDKLLELVEPRVGLVPVKEIFPPIETKPVPVVIGRLLVVLSDRVPADSSMVVPEAKLMVVP